ncbi:hypothetical protein [Lewinella sp. W8]|uniref:hypothetical protein n=1 Tax=Lewinella sp. W8 TaxID=2528208 RepID=UPI0010689AE2|nr:hypothetical protein [Lewinella sp. W8]MTB53025.1 hypothetical protein [Lewinella sp. W8]
MPTKYKLYYATNGGEYGEEFYSKADLMKHNYAEEGEDVDLFECAGFMLDRFNRKAEYSKKRHCYKLEKVTVRVLGSYPFYGLNVSEAMCEPEFK